MMDIGKNKNINKQFKSKLSMYKKFDRIIYFNCSDQKLR